MGGDGTGARRGGGNKGGGSKGGKGGKGRGGGAEEGKGRGGGRGGGRGRGGGGGGEDAYGQEWYYEAADYGYAGYAPTMGYGGALPGAWGWQPAAVVAPPMPAAEEWKEFKSEDGTPYFYNKSTGLTQWDKPQDLDKPVRTPLTVPADMQQGGFGAQGHSNFKGGKGGFGGGGDVVREEQRRARNNARGEGGDDSGRKGDGDGGRGRGNREKRGKGGRDREKKGAEGGKEGTSEFGPPGCNLFVFHLPDDWNDDDLLEAFGPHGQVISAKIMKELGTGRSRGFGFVSYEDRISTATAIKKMQGYKILGKRLKVEFKKGEAGENSESFQGGDASHGGLDGGAGGGTCPDDERLIGYLRAISAKNVVQSLKESEGRRGDGGDEEDD